MAVMASCPQEIVQCVCPLWLFQDIGLQMIFYFIPAINFLNIISMSTQLNFQWLGNVFAHLVKLPLEYFEKRHGNIETFQVEAPGREWKKK